MKRKFRVSIKGTPVGHLQRKSDTVDLTLNWNPFKNIYVHYQHELIIVPYCHAKVWKNLEFDLILN